MKHSQQLANLGWLQQLKDEGIRVPALDNLPSVTPAEIFYWEGFTTLSAQRFVGEEGAPQPIRVDDIRAHLFLVGVEEDRETVRDFYRIVVALDRKYIEFRRTQQKKQRQKTAKKKTQARRRR